MRKKVVSAVLLMTMMSGLATGCGASGSNGDSNTSDGEAAGNVYYLNFKPEQDEAWQDLAAEYTDETGVKVTVRTAASGTYESTLKSEMAKTDAPTLFQVNGPVGLANWTDYCYDLKESALYKDLSSDDFALIAEDGSVQGIAYVLETYGLIYNKAILEDYFKLEDRKSVV